MLVSFYTLSPILVESLLLNCVSAVRMVDKSLSKPIDTILYLATPLHMFLLTVNIAASEVNLGGDRPCMLQ
jgi:hypothetical protein